MKFLSDAHISVEMAAMIRGLGHDCLDASAIPPRMPDVNVLRMAADDGRVVDPDKANIDLKHGRSADQLGFRRGCQTDRLAGSGALGGLPRGRRMFPRLTHFAVTATHASSPNVRHLPCRAAFGSTAANARSAFLHSDPRTRASRQLN